MEAKAAGQGQRPSLVVCPSTLVPHWPHELERFVASAQLRSVQYEGPPATRRRLQVLLGMPLLHCTCFVTKSSVPAGPHELECFVASAQLHSVQYEGPPATRRQLQGSARVDLPAVCVSAGAESEQQAGCWAAILPAVRQCILVQAEASSADLVVMSYETLRSDADWVSGVSWLYCVLDEGHMIRNPKSKIAQVRPCREAAFVAS